MIRIVALFLPIALVSSATLLPGSPPPATTAAEAPVDQLIPWLLNEDRQLRGIPFAEVILDTTGKRVLPVDRKTKSTSG